MITPDETGDADDERSVLSQNIEPDVIDLSDRGFERYSLLALITRMNVGRRAFNMVCLFLQGWADADELADALAGIQAWQMQGKNFLKISGAQMGPSSEPLHASQISRNAIHSMLCNLISPPNSFHHEHTSGSPNTFRINCGERDWIDIPCSP